MKPLNNKLLLINSIQIIIIINELKYKQGSTLSPSLFDIYLEFVINIVKNKINIDIFFYNSYKYLAKILIINLTQANRIGIEHKSIKE
jgi:hypothetical protein